mgnify:FL=1
MRGRIFKLIYCISSCELIFYSTESYCYIVCKCSVYNILLSYCVSCCCCNLSVISNSSFQLSKECALAKQYIDINYSKNITLDSLAEITHINKFYLAHSFTECIGQSPINYLADRRIEACKELLTTSDLSVTQIASSAGFSSQSYFSQIFNKKVGMSPRQYRKLYSHEKKE